MGDDKKGEYGEGNYKASRQYNDATKKFVESGRVDKAAHDAAPKDSADARELADAEAKGKSRAKEEDPALTRRTSQSSSDKSNDPAGNRTPDRSSDQSSTPKPGQGGR
ncbi:MAG TPA: hypothetical protein VNG69_12980 [Casimicrobiaceae bacterium]|nr:hypothetical protein [Casimicrobiaceae bacterium]